MIKAGFSGEDVPTCLLSNMYAPTHLPTQGTFLDMGSVRKEQYGSTDTYESVIASPLIRRLW